MDDEMSARSALAAAGSARHGASAPAVPGWFPVASAPAFTAGLTLAGVSLLAGGGTGRAAGLAAAAVLAGWVALWVLLVAWWRRRGVVPAPPRLDRRRSPRQRRAALAADFAAIALSVAALAVTGSPGWAAITAGWLLGAALWYRLRLHAV